MVTLWFFNNQACFWHNICSHRVVEACHGDEHQSCVGFFQTHQNWCMHKCHTCTIFAEFDPNCDDWRGAYWVLIELWTLLDILNIASTSCHNDHKPAMNNILVFWQINFWPNKCIELLTSRTGSVFCLFLRVSQPWAIPYLSHLTDFNMRVNKDVIFATYDTNAHTHNVTHTFWPTQCDPHS